VEDDLRTFLAEGPDGRHRFRFLRSAVVTAWSEMAHPPPSLGAYAGPVVLVPGIREDYVTDALRASLRRDAGPRLRERPVDAGHMVFWDAQEEVGAILRELVAEAYGTGTEASRGS
jgi:hypothetical protein